MSATTSTNSRFVRCSLIIENSSADLVSDLLYADFNLTVQLDSYSDPERTKVFFYLLEPIATVTLEQIARSVRGALKADPEINVEGLIEPIDWESSYRSSVRPILVEDVLIRPTWSEAPREVKCQYEILLDPKMAFGTGSHETTRLCLQAIRKLVQKGMTVADVGCGSGILAILAAKLGARLVCAVDNDPLAVTNTLENAELNHVSAAIQVVEGSVVGAVAKCGRNSCDIVVANIILSALLQMLGELKSLLKPGGTLILSGLLQADEQEMLEALQDIGITDAAVSSEGEWISIVGRTAEE